VFLDAPPLTFESRADGFGWPRKTPLALSCGSAVRHPGNKHDKQKLADAEQRGAVIKVVVKVRTGLLDCDSIARTYELFHHRAYPGNHCDARRLASPGQDLQRKLCLQPQPSTISLRRDEDGSEDGYSHEFRPTKCLQRQYGDQITTSRLSVASSMPAYVRCSRNARSAREKRALLRLARTWSSLATQTEAYEKIVCELVKRISAHGKQSQVHWSVV
jgi:hypothetical protein